MAKIPNVLILEVKLLDTDPEVWRLIEIQDKFTLHDLHKAIQISMGWNNAHLYEFLAQRGNQEVQFILPEYLEFTEKEEVIVNDPKLFSLKSIFVNNGDSIEYVYDFGDGWRHSVVMRGRTYEKSMFGQPVCVSGARACPPEDIGGIGGYLELLNAIKTKNQAQLKFFRNWLGYSFNPDDFQSEKLIFMKTYIRRMKP